MDNLKILGLVDDAVCDIMLHLQDELGIIDGCEPFDVRLDEIEGELTDEIRRIIEYQITMRDIERR